MRPPEFTGGNYRHPPRRGRGAPRFNEAAGIHRRKHLEAVKADNARLLASMRPPEFTGGNAAIDARGNGQQLAASMRPPEFTGGNRAQDRRWRGGVEGFNEAAGIHRRKHQYRSRVWNDAYRASMRPPEFTGGNLARRRRWRQGIPGLQ